MDVYKPRLHVLIDIVLTVDLGFFLMYAFSFFEFSTFVIVCMILDILLILIWVFVVQPLFKVSLSDEEIQGPSDKWTRTGIALREVNRMKMQSRTLEAKKYGYHEIVAIGGKKKIRLWTNLLGKQQVHKIKTDIDKIKSQLPNTTEEH